MGAETLIPLAVVGVIAAPFLRVFVGIVVVVISNLFAKR